MPLKGEVGGHALKVMEIKLLIMEKSWNCVFEFLWEPRIVVFSFISFRAAKEGLEKTLMERVIGFLGDSVVRMLTTQYRMNTKIMQWSSDKLYQSRLVAHQSVENHLLV